MGFLKHRVPKCCNQYMISYPLCHVDLYQAANTRFLLVLKTFSDIKAENRHFDPYLGPKWKLYERRIYMLCSFQEIQFMCRLKWSRDFYSKISLKICILTPILENKWACAPTLLTQTCEILSFASVFKFPHESPLIFRHLLGKLNFDTIFSHFLSFDSFTYVECRWTFICAFRLCIFAMRG